MSKTFKFLYDNKYHRDRDGNYYSTVEDNVVEVLTEEQLKGWYSNYMTTSTIFLESVMRGRIVPPKFMKIHV